MMFRTYSKLRLLFLSFYFTLLFLFKACFSSTSLKYGNKKFIVSMTTYGWRYNFVFLTIESILSQCTKPSAIYLWIYKGDNPSFISRWFLRRQMKRGLIIKTVDRDVKSYKKLSFIFDCEMPGFEYVVTADDDVFYPKTWLKKFSEHQNLNSHILCYRGRVITLDSKTKLPVSYKNWPLAKLSDNKNNNILPTGVSGICYPVSSLDDRISDFDNIKVICPHADDIWYKLITMSNGYKSLVIDEKDSHYPPVLTSLTKGLEKLNVNDDMNIKQFNSAISHLELDYRIFERES